MATTSKSIMPCPICRTELRMAERQGIEIDTCPTCRGVWLDRGELDKIIERSAAEIAPPPSQSRPHPAQGSPWPTGYRDDDHRHYGYKKRKKSFLSDLFD